MSDATQTFDPGAVADYEIRRHYDVPTEFYRLWLDPTLTYSCALFEPGDDLERAQQRKLDYVISLGGADGAERVLDVGCGWGSMLRRLVDAHGVRSAVGLTVSASQAEWIAAQGDERIDVRLESWSDHRPDEPYDGIVSIGAIEHFALKRTTREDRLATYREFFDRCRDMLVDAGRLGLQTVAKGGAQLDRQAVDDFRVIDEVFPDSAIPWPSEMLEASEGRFQLESIAVHGEHYARTCRAWERNLRARHDEAAAIAGGETTDLWERYLAASARRFEQGHATLLRLGFQRL